MHDDLSRLERREFLKSATFGAAGVVLSGFGLPRALGYSYYPAQNTAALYNWLVANNTSTNLNAWLGAMRGMSAYYPPGENLNKLTGAQRTVLLEYTQQFVGLISTSMQTAIRQMAAANIIAPNSYYPSGYIAFVSESWTVCYNDWDYLYGLFFIPVTSTGWWDAWWLYYYTPPVAYPFATTVTANTFPWYLWYAPIVIPFTPQFWNAIGSAICSTTANPTTCAEADQIIQQGMALVAILQTISITASGTLKTYIDAITGAFAVATGVAQAVKNQCGCK
jgi:hypothetical protein